MNNSEIKNRIQKLREEISRLRLEYHVKNNPKVTDDVYESLTRELNNLEKEYPEFIDPDSLVNRVAGKPLPSFKKVKHEIRMTSLNDIFSKEEIYEWEKRIKKFLNKDFSYFCELKLDGLSASLIYEKGVFIRGATRGDGFIGEDITQNLKMIGSIPLKLNPPYNDYMEIRGEVVMFKKVWEQLNKKQEEQGKPTFANTRNAAAGSLRQLDPSIAKERKLDFFAWDIAKMSSSFSKHSEEHELLRKLGFQVCPFEKKTKKIDDVYKFIEEIGEKRSSLPYGTDGMVISVDEIELHETLGIVGKAPRYMIAYKYQAERATTTVTNITVNVGRTGAITPLAHFNPTLVAGSTVSKSTLHNMDQIGRLDIRIGDTVVIQKAGDVIPEVVEVLKNMRTGKEKKFKMLEICPVCEKKIEKKETLGNQSNTQSVAYYCTNKNCPARSRRGLQHFVNIFEIYEIGPKILDRLKDEGLISDAADLFTLEKSDLSGLERFGEKSADNIITSIQTHKKVLLWRFVYALGIIHVGEQTSRDLADSFGSLEKLIKAEKEEINNIENIGPAVSESIFEFFRDKASLNLINKLIENGVNIYHEKVKKGTLSGKTFVLTGTLPTLSREDAKKKIIENGGSVSSGVSSKTSYVLAGENPGSKYTDAQKLKVSIISESDFLKMI
jgi:DNA ligase (NAD+)